MGSAACSRSAKCPRCGYEQRGVIDTWKESCPLTCTCTECGLLFEWAEVLSVKIRKPRWCVESAPSRWSVLGRGMQTFGLTFWPWGFWKSLKMSHEIRWRRIAAYLILMLVGLYVIFCVAHGALVFGEWDALNRAGWAVPIDWLQIAKAMLLPLSGKPPAGLGSLIPSPRALFHEYWADSLILPLILIFLTFHALCVAGFIALPVSRRKARVRWSHIFRVALYGMVFIAPTITLFLVGNAIWVLGLQALLTELMMVACVMIAIAILPLEVIWWSTATGRYLRMPHAWGVGVVIVVMAGLTVLVGVRAGLFF